MTEICLLPLITFDASNLSGLAGYMVLNATFNNISVISGWSFLLVEETTVPG